MNIFLAITCYNHQLYGECSEAILKNCVSLIKAGHIVTPYYSNDLYIDRSRNMCVNLFLDSACTDLVFVDSDLAFDDDAILKLMKYDKDIVAGAYPYKKSQLEFPVTLKYDHQMNCKEEETGLVYATRVPTGLMRIQRKVFEKLKCEKDERGIEQFFKTGMVVKNDPNWYGEDTYFCRKCIDAGIELYIEPRINFTHIGNQEFKGNYHEYLMKRRADKLDAVETGIEGWMTDNELNVLKYLASKCDSIVEIGSWKGRSTKELLESCRGTVYAVDHWLGSAGDLTEIATFNKDIYSEFINNVGHYPNLEVLRGNSVEIASQFNDKTDMVFIDAGHTYEECKTDIEAWLPKCDKIICGHDYSFPGVIQAVNEKFGKPDHVIDSIWIKEL
jgi:predicted O-methyltransferase YrrM